MDFMTKERFKDMFGYDADTASERFNFAVRCNCQECLNKDCKHRDCYRRHPVCLGGLGLCERLEVNYDVFEVSVIWSGHIVFQYCAADSLFALLDFISSDSLGKKALEQNCVLSIEQI